MQFEKDCADEMSQGNTGSSNTGNSDPQNDLSFNSTLNDIKEISERLYGNILDDLLSQGNTKAIEKIHTITKELTEGYNISFKVIKI